MLLEIINRWKEYRKKINETKTSNNVNSITESNLFTVSADSTKESLIEKVPIIDFDIGFYKVSYCRNYNPNLDFLLSLQEESYSKFNSRLSTESLKTDSDFYLGDDNLNTVENNKSVISQIIDSRSQSENIISHDHKVFKQKPFYPDDFLNAAFIEEMQNNSEDINEDIFNAAKSNINIIMEIEKINQETASKNTKLIKQTDELINPINRLNLEHKSPTPSSSIPLDFNGDVDKLPFNTDNSTQTNPKINITTDPNVNIPDPNVPKINITTELQNQRTQIEFFNECVKKTENNQDYSEEIFSELLLLDVYSWLKTQGYYIILIPVVLISINFLWSNRNEIYSTICDTSYSVKKYVFDFDYKSWFNKPSHMVKKLTSDDSTAIKEFNKSEYIPIDNVPIKPQSSQSDLAVTENFVEDIDDAVKPIVNNTDVYNFIPLKYLPVIIVPYGLFYLYKSYKNSIENSINESQEHQTMNKQINIPKIKILPVYLKIIRVLGYIIISALLIYTIIFL